MVYRLQWRRGSAISVPKATVLLSLHRRGNCLCSSGNTFTVIPSSPGAADLDMIVLPPDLLVISNGWHFPDTRGLTKQDLWSFPLFLALSGHMWELPDLPAIAESISWTQQPGSLQSCSAYPTCGYLTCLWSHTLTIRNKVHCLGNIWWESPAFKVKY